MNALVTALAWASVGFVLATGGAVWWAQDRAIVRAASVAALPMPTERTPNETRLLDDGRAVMLGPVYCVAQTRDGQVQALQLDDEYLAWQVRCWKNPRYHANQPKPRLLPALPVRASSSRVQEP